MKNKFLKNENICIGCNTANTLVHYSFPIDKMSWRCMNKNYRKYKQYTTVRDNSFTMDSGYLCN